MSAIPTYSVGRSRDCDLVLSHPSISRVHLEVVCLESDFYITDKTSSGGTFVRRDKAWVQIKQAQVPASAQLRLGKYELNASELAVLRKPHSQADDAHTPKPKDKLNADLGLRRDPITGEVVEG